jgi:hypothetical protein
MGTKDRVTDVNEFKWKKKPVVVEAFEWTGSTAVLPDRLNWLHIALNTKLIVYCGKNLMIRTLEGQMTAQPGDFVIQGIAGEIYPCKPDIFKKTYDKVYPQYIAPPPERCPQCYVALGADHQKGCPAKYKSTEQCTNKAITPKDNE